MWRNPTKNLIGPKALASLYYIFILMAGVITTIFEGVGTLVKYGFWSTVGAAGLGGGYLALTKPQKETFSPYFQSLITKNEGQKTSIGERLAKWPIKVPRA